MVNCNVPNTWREYELSQLCTKLVVGFVGTCEDFYTDGSSGVMMLRTGDIKGTRIDFSNAKYISDDFHERNKKSQLKCGDVLIARHGSSGHGVVFDSNKPANALNIVILRTNDTLILSKYLVQLLDSQEIQKQIIEASAGSTQNVINTSQIAKISTCIPCVSEQRKIVDICESIDSLLENLEKQISKKRAIKQGAMQELLTGKKRLPGFSGKWISGKWKEVLDCFSSGATPYRGNPTFYKGSIKWASSGELNYSRIMDTLEHISTEAKEKANLTIHPAGTFLMAITGLEAAGTRGSCAILGAPATTNQSCMAIYGTDKMSTEYLFHYYVQHGDELAFQYCQGTKQQSYTAAIVKELPIYYPEDVAEQNAIASVLTSMDNEVRALEQKLAKYRQVKQGMMQQLLTGKIRLTEDR